MENVFNRSQEALKIRSENHENGKPTPRRFKLYNKRKSPEELALLVAPGRLPSCFNDVCCESYAGCGVLQMNTPAAAPVSLIRIPVFQHALDRFTRATYSTFFFQSNYVPSEARLSPTQESLATRL